MSNPKVMQNKQSFEDTVSASSAKDAAKKLFSNLAQHMHNDNKIDMCISINKQDGAGKVYHYKCTKESAENDSTISLVSYKIPDEPAKSGSWGEQSGGGEGDAARARIKKKMEKTKGGDSDSDSSDSDSFNSYTEPVYFVYDPFYYGNYLYSSYILGRSILLPNFSYNLSGYWWF